MQNGSLRGPREDCLPHTIISDDPSRTPVHEASAIGDEKTLEALLVAGADRNVKDTKHGNTPLHEAAWRGYSRCVKLLCALPKPKAVKEVKESKHVKSVILETKGVLHSALLGTRNFGGFSALHLAAQNGHNQSCREILLAGGDPDVQNNYGDTPLHTACRYGHAGATRILLSAKCDLQRINLNGDTPLHIACAMGRRKLTRILLEAGCLQEQKNAQNETPRDIAQRKGLTEIIEILNTPVTQIRRDRERSSSSSRHNNKQEDVVDAVKKTKAAKSKVEKSKEKVREKGKEKEPTKEEGNEKPPCDPNPKNWSPYGCHYFPDPRSFPSPKLETLPKEPLGKGEQYYLDLAGNIRKGPIGVGNTCYCGPFFKHIEEKISKNRKSIRKYVDRATEKLDNKVAALALRTEDQIEELTRSMIADRIRCEGRRLHLEQWLKRGGLSRATIGTHHSSKSRKDQANANTLTRCRSLEFLDDEQEESVRIDGKMKTSVTGFSRSADLLDTHQVEVHRSDIGSSSKEIDRDRDNRSSGLGSDRDHSAIGIKRMSLVSDDSRTKLDYQLSHHHQKGSKKSSDKSSSLIGSDMTNRSSFVMPVDYGKSMNNDERLDVSERLEELLSKTNEIIEMERATRRRNKEIFMLFSPNEKMSKSRLKNEKLKVTHSGRDRLRSHQDIDDSQYIAQEMEKITSSLLKGSSHNSQKEEMHENAIPASPEIAKDNVNEKELSLSGIRNKQSDIDSLNSSVYVPDFSRGHHQPNSMVEGCTSFTNNTQDSNSPSPAAIHHQNHANHANMMNGFYQNVGFDDAPSSSSNTLKSEKQKSDTRSEIEMDRNNGYENDDKGEELSELANFREINELKSRILNGSHWRSQVLRRSAQDYNQHQPTSPLNNGNVTPEGVSQIENSIPTKYEIKNSEIKTLKSSNVCSDEAETSFMPSRSKVHELVARIQGRTDLHNNSRGAEASDSKCTKNDDQSESSDDEEEIDFDHMDAHRSMSNGLEREEDYYLHQSDPYYGQQSANNMKNFNNGIYPTNSGVYYHRAQPQVANYRSGLSQYFQSHQVHTSAPQIDTSCLIPKDAYFHELPNRNRMRPITDKLPEKQFIEINQQQSSELIANFSARNRNPLPYHLNDVEILNQSQMPYNPLLNNPVIHSQPTMAEYDRPIRVVPQREKLLSSRKFGYSNLVDMEIELTRINGNNVDASSTTSSTSVTNREHLIIDQAQLDRDMHNDSGYSTKICGSSHGPSPSLSGQTDSDLGGTQHHGAIMTNGGNGNKFDGNIYLGGASSLV